MFRRLHRVQWGPLRRGGLCFPLVRVGQWAQWDRGLDRDKEQAGRAADRDRMWGDTEAGRSQLRCIRIEADSNS